MILKKLGVKDNEVISIGDSVVDKEMSDNGNVPFVAAIWDSQDAEALKEYINHPRFKFIREIERMVKNLEIIQ